MTILISQINICNVLYVLRTLLHNVLSERINKKKLKKKLSMYKTTIFHICKIFSVFPKWITLMLANETHRKVGYELSSCY